MRTTSSDLPVNTFGGVEVLGVRVTNLHGAHVSVAGADDFHLGGLPPVKDRVSRNSAFLAVLDPSAGRRAVMDDQCLDAPNPYVVLLTPANGETEGELYVPNRPSRATPSSSSPPGSPPRIRQGRPHARTRGARHKIQHLGGPLRATARATASARFEAPSCGPPNRP